MFISINKNIALYINKQKCCCLYQSTKRSRLYQLHVVEMRFRLGDSTLWRPSSSQQDSNEDLPPQQEWRLKMASFHTTGRCCTATRHNKVRGIHMQAVRYVHFTMLNCSGFRRHG